ncbi:MAG: A24 family peptidase [Butyrivibrio sp.]|nr:A24 family peptidase [Acetatifactor muris]MCM1559517.1 A24 family peptidase [Butyrivibrio sp.]
MAVLCLLLTAACGFDYRNRKIPNGLVALTVLAGMAFRLQRDGMPGVPLYLGKAAAITALLYPIYKIGGLGAGDVKLLGAAAGYLPFGKIFLFSFVSLLIAAFISLIKLSVNKNFRERLGLFLGYLKDIAEKGALQPYPAAGKEERSAGVCLSGPMLLSLLLCLGGVY